MLSHYNNFIHLLFIGIIALFPVVNPVGSAFILSPYFENLNDVDKKTAVRTITFYAFCVCTVALFAGRWILMLFGLSIPVIQIAGGIMICKMGWESLSSNNTDSTEGHASPNNEVEVHDSIQNKLFYPITFPVTTGAGTISVLFTLSAHSSGNNMTNYLISTGAIFVAIIIICAMIYFFYLNTKRIIHYLGSSGETIVNRISAFLIFCVGLQIAVSGITALVKG